MADLQDVVPELAGRIRGMQNEAGQRGIVLVVTTGYRTFAEQQRLYDAMVAAQLRHGRKWQQHAALAAVPGTSHNGTLPATAVDLECASPTKNNIKIHGELATKCGLYRAVISEYWHLELMPHRDPLPDTKEQAMTLVIDPIAAVDRPQGDGGWTVGRRGHVYDLWICATLGRVG